MTVAASDTCAVEDPSKDNAGADIPVDVLFDAFEKFLKRAWKAKMGSVITTEALDGILTRSGELTRSRRFSLSLIPRVTENLCADDFDEYFRATSGEFTPQNRQAFKTLLALLSRSVGSRGVRS